MKELLEYRQKLLERLGEAASEFRAACLAVEDPYAPIEKDGWSAHQVAVHVRDVDRLVYGWRIRRTLEEENPEFPNFDGDAYMREHYDPAEPLDKILAELTASVEESLRLLRTLPPQAWARPSRHQTQGSGLTLQTWVERGLRHIEEHLETIKRAGR